MEGKLLLGFVFNNDQERLRIKFLTIIDVYFRTMEVAIITAPTLPVRFNVLVIQHTSYKWIGKLADVSEASHLLFQPLKAESNIYQTQETVFHHISSHGEES